MKSKFKKFSYRRKYEQNPFESVKLADWKVDWQDLFVKADLEPRILLKYICGLMKYINYIKL